MPPKKKVIPKLNSLLADNKASAPSTETFTMLERQKIRNRPFFRTVKISSLNKIYEVRIKLWKLKSWTLGAGSRFESNPYNRVAQTIKTLSSPTFRKSLKFIRNFDFSKNRLIQIPNLKRIFSNLSRVESLALIANRQNTLTKTFLKKILNPQIQSLYLDSDFSAFQNEGGNEVLRKVFKSLNKVKKCATQIKLYMHSCSIIVGTKWPIEFSRIQDHSKENMLFKPSLLSLKNSIQELSIDLSYTPFLGNIEDLQDIQFPHLKKFKYKFSRKFEVTTEDPLQPVYLSFLGNCPELEVLNLELSWANIESLSFLAFLQKLRDFSLKAEYFTKCSETHIPNIPALTTLERLKIYIQFGTVDLQNISQLIQMNSKIKTIEITLSMDRILEVFTENIEFLLLENLSLGVLQIDPKNQKQLKAFKQHY